MDASGIAVAEPLTILTGERRPWRKRLLRRLAKDGNLTRACALVGTSRQNVMACRKRNPRFDRAYKRALADSRKALTDRAEEALATRSIDGWAEPVYQMGREVGTKQRYDHAGLRFLLEHNSKRYAPKATSASVNVTIVNADQQRQALMDPREAELLCQLAAIRTAPVAALDVTQADPPPEG